MIPDRLPPLALPSLAGRRAVVTGANSGIGFATARALAQAGADVVLGVRDPARGEAARTSLASAAPRARFEVEVVDLGSLASVRAFAERVGREPVDLLINNAGLSAPDTQDTTEDGFELHWGVNYLGSFALTGLLLPALCAASRGARVVTLGSMVARVARLDRATLSGSRAGDPRLAYANSKLAMIMFARELHRRSLARDWRMSAVAAHPGWSDTPIFDPEGPFRIANRLGAVTGLMQSPADGAQPILLAATTREVRTGDYFGPTRHGGLSGPPGVVRPPRRALDDNTQGELWNRSIALTGVSFTA